MPALQKKHKKSSVHNIKSVMNTRYGRGDRIRTCGILVPNLCLNFQRDLLRSLWRFPSLLRFLFETLLACLFQPPLSAFGICVGLNSVY